MNELPGTLKLPARPTDHELTLVIPAYNEERVCREHSNSCAPHLDAWGVDFRVVVVDDGSRDATVSVASNFGPRFSAIALPHNQGKGAAVRAGMLNATGRVVAFTDADLPYDLKSLRAGFDLIRSGACQVAFGARDFDGSQQLVARRTLRRLASVVFSRIVSVLISRDVTDTQAGLKLFSREACRAIFSRTVINGFAFDAEVVYLTRLLQISYRRIPVVLINEETSSLSIWRHTLPMLREVIQVRLRGLRGEYGSAATAIPFATDHQGDDQRKAAA